MKIALAIVVIFSTYILLKLTNFMLNRFSKKYHFLHNVNHLLQVMVPIIWTIIGFWSVKYLFQNEAYYHLVVSSSVIIISGLVGWFFIKDFIAGIIFRLQNNYLKGESIQFGSLIGQLESMQLTHLLIQTKEGKLMKVPYSRLSNEIISENTQIIASKESIIQLKTNKKESTQKTENAIRKVLLASPWPTRNTHSLVVLKEEGDQHYYFEIRVEVRNSTHIEYLKEGLEKRFGK